MQNALSYVMMYLREFGFVFCTQRFWRRKELVDATLIGGANTEFIACTDDFLLKIYHFELHSMYDCLSLNPAKSEQLVDNDFNGTARTATYQYWAKFEKKKRTLDPWYTYISLVIRFLRINRNFFLPTRTRLVPIYYIAICVRVSVCVAW